MVALSEKYTLPSGLADSCGLSDLRVNPAYRRPGNGMFLRPIRYNSCGHVCAVLTTESRFRA